MYDGDKVNPQEAGRLMAEQAQAIIDRRESAPAFRKPEPNAQVYNLGHFETMQLAATLQTLLDALNSDGSFSFDADSLDFLDFDVIRQFRSIFNEGTFTIIRTLDEE